MAGKHADKPMHALIRLHISGAKDAKKAENLEVARQKLVHAMKKGLNIYVSMQQASPPFNDWLSNDESFPALEVFTNCGASLRAKEVCVCVCVGVWESAYFYFSRLAWILAHVSGPCWSSFTATSLLLIASQEK